MCNINLAMSKTFNTGLLAPSTHPNEIDWKLCMICQDYKEELQTCPSNPEGKIQEVATDHWQKNWSNLGTQSITDSFGDQMKAKELKLCSIPSIMYLQALLVSMKQPDFRLMSNHRPAHEGSEERVRVLLVFEEDSVALAKACVLNSDNDAVHLARAAP